MKSIIILVFIIVSTHLIAQDIIAMEETRMEVYPYSTCDVNSIKSKLSSISDFEFQNIYFGNNRFYIPLVSVKSNKSIVVNNKNDSTYLISIQNKILDCIPEKGVVVTTIIFRKNKPYLIMSLDRDKQNNVEFDFVDSIRTKMSKKYSEIQNVMTKSLISSHQLKSGYYILNSCGFMNLSFLKIEIITKDSLGNNFFSTYFSKFLSFDPNIEKTESINHQKDFFSVPYTTIDENYKYKKELAYYYDIENGLIIKKQLGYVKIYTERYSEIMLKVF